MEEPSLNDLFVLALVNYKRAFTQVGPHEDEARITAAHAAIHQLHQCMHLLQQQKIVSQSKSWIHLGSNYPFLVAEYLIASIYQTDINEANVWVKVVRLHHSCRHFLNYIWTLFQLKVPDLHHHFVVVAAIQPNGKYSLFDLRAIHSSSWTESTYISLKFVIDLELRQAQTRANDPLMMPSRLDELQVKASTTIKNLADIANELQVCLSMANVAGTGSLQGMRQLSEIPTPDDNHDIIIPISTEEIKAFYSL